MMLDIRPASLKNMIECVQDSDIKAKGNFWACIQHMESQLEEMEDEE